MKLAGIDVGGTFTDVILVDRDAGEIRIHKVPTTPEDPARGLIDGVEGLEGRIEALDFLVHGTTIAT
jgi:N-methylhydantoinase A